MLNYDVSDLASKYFRPEEFINNIPPDPWEEISDGDYDRLLEELFLWIDEGYFDEYNHLIAQF